MHESRWGMTLLVAVLLILLLGLAAWNGFLWGKISALRDSVNQLQTELNSQRVQMQDIDKQVNLHDRALRELGRSAEDIELEQEGKPKVEEVLKLLSRIARILL